MIDDSIDDLNRLLETIEAEGWTVTSIGADEYRTSGWGDGEVMGVEVELTVYVDYREGDDENAYRIK